jgi:hypothetical protein
MVKILTFIVFISVLSFEAMGNNIEIFNQNIKLPLKYKLEVLASLSTKANTIVYRSGSFIRPSKNGTLEVVTVGKVSDYISDNEKSKIEELGLVIKHNEFFNELKSPKSSFKIEGNTFYYRMYFDKEVYISYFTLDINDIDQKLKLH